MTQLTWQRYCLNCGKPYIELYEIGSWNCKYHTGTYNRISDGVKWPKYSWECCGISDVAYLDDGRRNPRFCPTYVHGCTAKDHSAIQNEFTVSDNITESEFPDILLKELDRDIRKIKSGKIADIIHKGLNIDSNTGFLFIERYNKNEVLKRQTYKMDKNNVIT